MRVLGRWFKQRGNLIITFTQKLVVNKKKISQRIKYLGDVEEPVIIADVEADLSKELQLDIMLLTSNAGRSGNIVGREVGL
jgi:hypothetical protein